MDPLSPDAYERLRRATRTHREDLVVRLCGEVGLRPADLVDLEPRDVAIVDGTHVATIGDRTTVLPAAVAHDLRKYVASERIDDDEHVFGVSARRLQMLVSETADRAASATGDDRFRDVSTRSLREHFVVSRLREGADPRIVAAAAGFDSIAGLAPYLDDPTPVEIAAGLAADGHALATTAAVPDAVDAATRLLEAVGEAVTAHETPESLFEAVVARAASVDGYRYAWVASHTDAAGPASDHARDRDATRDDDGSRNGDATVVASAGVDEAVVTAELDASGDAGRIVSRDVGAAEGARYVLGLGVDARDEGEFVALLHDAVGVLVERAFEAVRRRRILVADLVTDLRFDVEDADAPLVALATELDAAVSVTGVVPGDPGLVVYAETDGVDPQAVVDAVADDESVERTRYVNDGDDGPIFEFAVRNSPARTLVDLDAQVTAYAITPGSGTLHGTVPADADVRALRDELHAEWPDTALVAQETVERTVDRQSTFQGRLRDDLTDRQLAVLQSAYHGGYFQWPRESTGEELADSLDVAAPTLHNHLRVAQRKLLDAFFDTGP
jgi:hypothetical protein